LSFTDGGEKVVKYGQVHFVKSKSEQMLKRLREIRKKARENRKQLKAD
jgi:adenylate kinase